MKAVLLGTAAYRDQYQDIDLVADTEFLDKLKSQKMPSDSHEEPGSLGSWYLFHIKGLIVEVTVPKSHTALKLVLNRQYSTQKTILGLPIDVADIPVLCALKKAHLILPHRWEHHIKEYQYLKEQLGVEHFKPSVFGVRDVFFLHRKECKQKAKPHPKLNQKKDEFFEDAEFKIFDHDSIHQAVALDAVPAYTLMQDGEVWCSKKKWKNLRPNQRLSCLIEEAAVLALERSIIPFLFLNRSFWGAQKAYQFALMKIATTITSGWFREYAIENYHKAAAKRPDFVTMFFDGIKKQQVKILKPEVVFNARNSKVSKQPIAG